jgi:hypothetical protein
MGTITSAICVVLFCFNKNLFIYQVPSPRSIRSSCDDAISRLASSSQYNNLNACSRDRYINTKYGTTSTLYFFFYFS